MSPSYYILALVFSAVVALVVIARVVVAFGHRAEGGFVWQFWHMEDADWHRNGDPSFEALTGLSKPRKINSRLGLAWHVLRGRPTLANITGHLEAAWTDAQWQEQEQRGVVEVRDVESFHCQAPPGVGVNFEDGDWVIPESGDLRHEGGHTWVEDDS